MLNSGSPFNCRKTSVMGSPLDSSEEEPVDCWVQQEIVGHIPGTARDFWIQLRVEHITW